VVRRLQPIYQVTGFFYNPNIFPEEEFRRRQDAVRRLSLLWHIPIEYGPYEYGRFREAVKGLENEPEGGKRCEVCFRLRLEECGKRAREIGCGAIATTLTIGPNKRADVINQIGRDVAAMAGIEFIERDWKKRDGFKHSVEISRELGLYRQVYCGCEFSIKEKAGRNQ